jgi:hypothetical protein
MYIFDRIVPRSKREENIAGFLAMRRRFDISEENRLTTYSIILPDPYQGRSMILFYLLAGHALMDFGLQSESMALEKSRHSKTQLQKEVPWYYWLTAHSLLHGGAVAVITQSLGLGITQSLGLGIAETVCHWVIDFAKCEKRTNIHVDQALHVACKLIWYALIVNGVRFDFSA